MYAVLPPFTGWRCAVARPITCPSVRHCRVLCKLRLSQQLGCPARAFRNARALSASASQDTEEVETSQADTSFAVALAKAADETKCSDLVVLNVGPLVSWTSYMVFCTVASKPQLLAVLARMEKSAFEQFGRQKQNTPGNSPWEILDYGDVVVHVFTQDQREYYDVEGFYAAAEEVELPFASLTDKRSEQLETKWTTS